MAKKSKLNTRDWDKKMQKLSKFVDSDLPRLSHDKFVKLTPRDTGHAQRKTRLRKSSQGFEIQANYDYAGVLDQGLFPNPPAQGTGRTRQGYSTQAPQGMSEPTLDYISDVIREFTRRI